MPAILRRNRWFRQPDGAVELDRSNPLAARASGVFAPWQWAASGNVIVPTGVGLAVRDNADPPRFVAPRDPAFQSASAVSVFVLGVHAPTSSGSGSILFGTRATAEGSGNRRGFELGIRAGSFFNGIAQFIDSVGNRDGSQEFNDGATGGAEFLGKPVALVYDVSRDTVSRATMRGRRPDSAAEYVTSQVTSATVYGDDTPGVNAPRVGGQLAGSPAALDFSIALAFWQIGASTPAQRAAFYENPWQVFQPRSPRIFSFATAATAADESIVKTTLGNDAPPDGDVSDEALSSASQLRYPVAQMTAAATVVATGSRASTVNGMTPTLDEFASDLDVSWWVPPLPEDAGGGVIVEGVGVSISAGAGSAAALTHEATSGRSDSRSQGSAAGLTVEVASARSDPRAQGSAAGVTFDPASGRSDSRALAASVGADAGGGIVVPGEGRSQASGMAIAVGVSIQAGVGVTIAAGQGGAAGGSLELAAARADVRAQGRAAGVALDASAARADARTAASAAGAGVEVADARADARGAAAAAPASIEQGTGRSDVTAAAAAVGVDSGGGTIEASAGVGLGAGLATAVGVDAGPAGGDIYDVGGPSTIDLFPSARVATPDRVFRRTK